ncbi:uncharacterized protein LY89DRAFT_790654 [Mollisia scopiformis]|uniref:SANT domain-containing protein n=1 Tax=Mollisia scopiformis TaxID=149040 RepID=A0A132B1J5_MOLSC|nr:uncharacterized protein LY89DRAFT_790654 [Mollisia scopiformis]KUJ06256.1 hypothetical protein LY89DRAFT_790654 [Mollisia scopiformis]
MDLDEAELFAGIPYPDDSGSAYEGSSENDSLSHDKDGQDREKPSKLKEKPAIVRGRSATRKNARKSTERSSSGKKSFEGIATVPREKQDSSSETDVQPFEDAQEWAANFQPPTLEDIRTPSRRNSRKRRALKPPSEIRSKRLHAYYDNDYRKLLNVEINDATYGELSQEVLEASQVGSSSWNAEEKELLFSSLARLGRDNVRGIAVQIGSKSEPEVQEYLQLLQANVAERKRKSRRNFMVADLPAATEINEECCIVLERAGDALAARQEMAEEKVEHSKWSDMWLVNENVSRLIERRRREEGGEEALEAVLPAGNLFIFKNWLELSQRVFMNPGTPREEDNWENLAEPSETPAVRATAFEDFHSLAVNITKKLLSTTIFCTMSRLRSGNYHYVKVSEVTADDVEAAVNILGLKKDSSQFWLGCPKRNNLEIIDDEENPEERAAVSLADNDVERELLSSRCSRSRSLSVSRHEKSRASSQASRHEEAAYSSPSEVEYEDPQDFESESSTDDEKKSAPRGESPDFTDPESPTVTTPNRRTRIRDRKAAELAHEAYTEALDMEASQKEEARLWSLIEQEPPFEVETNFDKVERPVAIRDEIEDGRNWRDHLEYWSPWETMGTPVPKSAFEKNRKRKSRRAKARAKGSWPRLDHSVDEPVGSDENMVSEEESDVEYRSQNSNSLEEEMDESDGGED